MFEVEKDWVTDAGFRAVVIMTDMGHRCGYVGLPQSHPLYGVDYSDESSVLTFPAGEEVGKGHAGDAPLPGSRMSEYKCADDVHRSLDYCIAECESLARQMVTRVTSAV